MKDDRSEVADEPVDAADRNTWARCPDEAPGGENTSTGRRTFVILQCNRELNCNDRSVQYTIYNSCRRGGRSSIC